MARNTGDLENPPTKVELHHLVGPVGEPKEASNRSAINTDHRGLRTAFELRVAGHMIAVPMSVSNHQGV